MNILQFVVQVAYFDFLTLLEVAWFPGCADVLFCEVLGDEDVCPFTFPQQPNTPAGGFTDFLTFKQKAGANQ